MCPMNCATHYVGKELGISYLAVQQPREHSVTGPLTVKPNAGASKLDSQGFYGSRHLCLLCRDYRGVPYRCYLVNMLHC